MAENLALERHRNIRRVQRTLVQVCAACLTEEDLKMLIFFVYDNATNFKRIGIHLAL